MIKNDKLRRFRTKIHEISKKKIDAKITEEEKLTYPMCKIYSTNGVIALNPMSFSLYQIRNKLASI